MPYKNKKEGLIKKRAASKLYYKRNHRKILARSRAYNKTARRKRYMRRYVKLNRARLNALARIYVRKNKNRVRANAKRSYRKHRKQRMMVSTYYRRKNIEAYKATRRRWYKRNRDKILARQTAYRRKNASVYNTYTQNRRARLRGDTNVHTAKEWAALKKKYKNSCIGCGRNEYALRKLGRRLAADHILPVAKGGKNSIDNIQPLCHSIRGALTGGCNNLKSATYIDYRKMPVAKSLLAA